jgi:hypothetical protein
MFGFLPYSQSAPADPKRIGAGIYQMLLLNTLVHSSCRLLAILTRGLAYVKYAFVWIFQFINPVLLRRCMVSEVNPTLLRVLKVEYPVKLAQKRISGDLSLMKRDQY